MTKQELQDLYDAQCADIEAQATKLEEANRQIESLKVKLKSAVETGKVLESVFVTLQTTLKTIMEPVIEEIVDSKIEDRINQHVDEYYHRCTDPYA